jgi:hypothetical protein
MPASLIPCHSYPYALPSFRGHIDAQLLLLNFTDLPQTRSPIRFKRLRPQHKCLTRLRSEIKVRIPAPVSRCESLVSQLSPLANTSSFPNATNMVSSPQWPVQQRSARRPRRSPTARPMAPPLSLAILLSAPSRSPFLVLMVTAIPKSALPWTTATLGTSRTSPISSVLPVGTRLAV